MQQPRPEPRLQLDHHPGDARLRDLQRIGGTHEAADVDHGGEGLHFLVALATGSGAGLGTGIAPVWIRKS